MDGWRRGKTRVGGERTRKWEFIREFRGGPRRGTGFFQFPAGILVRRRDKRKAAQTRGRSAARRNQKGTKPPKRTRTYLTAHSAAEPQPKDLNRSFHPWWSTKRLKTPVKISPPKSFLALGTAREGPRLGIEWFRRRGAEAKAEIGNPPSLRCFGGTRAESRNLK